MSLPLNLIIFCTTMAKKCYGENSSEYTYSRVIDSLFDQVDPDIFANKVLHLKSRPQEESKSKEIKDFCDSKGVRVIETKQNLSHHSENIQNHSQMGGSKTCTFYCPTCWLCDDDCLLE